MGRHSAPEGAAVDPVVAAALARRSAEAATGRRAEDDGGGLGWPGPTTTNESLGWPGAVTGADRGAGRPQRGRSEAAA